MKKLTQCYVYWKGYDHDIEYLIKRCEKCAQLCKNSSKVIMLSWYEPKTNGEHIYIDYAATIECHYFIMCVDAK